MKIYNTEPKKSIPPQSGCALNLDPRLDSVYEGKPLLERAAEYLTDKFRLADYWRFIGYSNGILKQVPCSIRGNATYAYYQRFRLDDLQRQINGRLKTDGKTHSNMLFMTHTLQYKIGDDADIERVWREGKEAISPFLRKMRKLGMVDYCLAIEAFELAGFHIHLAVIFDRQLAMEKTEKYVFKKGKKKKKIIFLLEDKALEECICQAWADAAGRDIEEAKGEVQCCYSQGVAGYLVKELKKVSCAEHSLKKFRKGKDEPADRKKIIAFYMADILKIRLLRVSRGLSSAKSEEGQGNPETTLFKECNNTTVEGEGEEQVEKVIPLFTLILKRNALYELVNYAIFEPWAGEISPEVPYYQKIKGIFDRIFNFSEIIADKERLKALIAEKMRLYKEKRKKREEAPEVHPVLPLQNS